MKAIITKILLERYHIRSADAALLDALDANLRPDLEKSARKALHHGRFRRVLESLTATPPPAAAPAVPGKPKTSVRDGSKKEKPRKPAARGAGKPADQPELQLGPDDETAHGGK